MTPLWWSIAPNRPKSPVFAPAALRGTRFGLESRAVGRKIFAKSGSFWSTRGTISGSTCTCGTPYHAVERMGPRCECMRGPYKLNCADKTEFGGACHLSGAPKPPRSAICGALTGWRLAALFARTCIGGAARGPAPPRRGGRRCIGGLWDQRVQGVVLRGGQMNGVDRH